KKCSQCTDITKNSCLATMDTMKNADLQIEVIRTDLFNGFCYSYMADLIVFNPPYVPSLAKEKNYEGSNTWYGGESGLETIDEFLVQAKNYMNLEATLYFICFSNSNVERLESFIQMKIISDYCVFGPKNCGSELLSVHCFKRIK
ncbi:MAG: S-adenosylmethionine-dependent methyltransferase, partial [Paramarteilia canceri]